MLNVAHKISQASEQSIGSRKLKASQLGSVRQRMVNRRYYQLDIGHNIIGEVLIYCVSQHHEIRFRKPAHIGDRIIRIAQLDRPR
jgi:hypothetical protein